MNFSYRAAVGVCVALLLGAPLAAATMSKDAGRSGELPAGGEGGAAALYSQLDNPAGNGVPDQDFEASFNAYDSQAADDFVVTDAAGWTVEQIRTVGTTGTPGGSTVTVNILTNSPGGGDPDLPGGAVAGCTYPGVVPTDTLGSFVIDLPAPCILAPGTYWVEIQTAQNFGSFGQHFWSNRTTQTNSESAWRNPGDGFASGCTSYAPATVCGVGGGAAPDLLFEVWGVIGGLGTDVSITKTGVASPGFVDYTITVTNNGGTTANGVVVTDTLPAEVSFISDDCGGANTPPWTWNIGSLGAAGSATCHIHTAVVTPGAILNTAGVAASNDSTPNNNSSSATVTGTPQVAIVEVPTLDSLGLALLLIALGASAVVMLRRRARA